MGVKNRANHFLQSDSSFLLREDRQRSLLCRGQANCMIRAKLVMKRMGIKAGLESARNNDRWDFHDLLHPSLR